MAGYEANQEHLKKLSLLGKPLARRSRRRCELCESSGVKLEAFEVPPVSSEPEFERTLFLCETCITQINKPAKVQPARWRCLSNAVWSETEVVQVMAVRLLRRLGETEAWASELLQDLYIEPETESWINQAN